MRTRGRTEQVEARAYLLRAGSERIERPKQLEGLRTKVVRSIPRPPDEPSAFASARELKAQLTVPKPLQMAPAERERLSELNRSAPRLRRDALATDAAAACGNHEAIGTVVPGTPLQGLDTVGTWVSMPIFENGIDGLSGFLFTTFSNIAAQTLEVLGAYSNDNLAELSVFDWSCVDGKDGTPPCGPDSPWVYVKSQNAIPARYKFSYWDGCDWRKALALANKSRAVFIETEFRPLAGMKLKAPLYVNEAKLLNWETLGWETFYARVYVGRDPQPPRPWGPTAFVEFISDTGCPDVPRLGFREVRVLPPAGAWQLAAPANSSFRFDLADTYHYGLLDPNHTWCISRT